MSVNNISNSQQKQHKKPSFSKTCAGATAGLLASSIPKIPLKKLQEKGLNALIKINSELSIDEFEQARSATQVALKKSGVGKKGVKIVEVDFKNSDKVLKEIYENLNKGICKFLPDKFKKILAEVQISQVEMGTNAFDTFGKKYIMQKTMQDMVISYLCENVTIQ